MSCPVVLRWCGGGAGVLATACCSSVGCPSPHTIRHVNKSSLIQKQFLILVQTSAHDLSADGATESTESVLNTDAIARPADAIVPHSMSEHDRRFRVFFSLEAGM